MKLKDNSTEPEGFNINSRRCNLWKEWEISIIGFGGMLGSARQSVFLMLQPGELYGRSTREKQLKRLKPF